MLFNFGGRSGVPAGSVQRETAMELDEGRAAAASFTPHPGGRPNDPRRTLTAIGFVVYDWDLASDRLHWGANAAEVLGLPDIPAWTSGCGFAEMVEAGDPGRAGTIAAARAEDEGSGVPYSVRYTIRPRPDRAVPVEDTGRWYAGPDGRPAFAHGVMRVRPPEAAPAEPPGVRERSAFLGQIAGDVGESGRSRRPLTVFAISIENLAHLNEQLGYEGGDAVLKAATERMRTVMRRRDRFARYAGNRFALALRGCSPDQARIAADRLRRVVSGEPIATGRGPVQVDLLVGSATAPDHALDAGGLLRRAEQGLTIAKSRLGPPVVGYDPGRVRKPGRRSPDDGLIDVVRLLNERRIVMARQPIVDATTRRTVFSEALLRVRHPDGTVVAAGHVIPATERSGLVPLVDARMLELAADRLARHPEERLSVNVSPATLDSQDWLATFAAHLGRHAGIAQRLIVEVTETAAIRDPDAMRRRLDAMKALGVAIAIDDFGSGHTSFRQLRDFPVDIVKLDGAFVQNLASSPTDGFFVRTLIDLAQHLGLATVAEWVEDEATARLLAGWGVDYLQGDHLGAPGLDEEDHADLHARTA